MLAFQNSKFPRLIAFTLIVSMTCAVSFAQQAKWKPWTPGTPLNPGDKVLARDFDNWVEGTVVGFFAGRMVNVRYVDPDFGETTRPFFPRDLRVPVKSNKKKSTTVSRGKSGKGENPFEAEDEFREWSDKSGKFKIEAELVESEKDRVVLKKRDGSQITVLISALSQQDQKYLTSRKPEEPVSQDTFGIASNAIAADWSDVKEIILDGEVPPNGLMPDAGPEAGPLHKKPLMLPPKSNISEQIRGVFPAFAENGLTAVGVLCTNSWQKYSGIYLCNLAEKTRKIGQIEIPDHSMPMEFGPYGKQLLTNPIGDFSAVSSCISLWTIDDNKCVKKWDCQPYSGRSGGSGSCVPWARFVDTEHLLTLSSDGQLTLWTLAKMKAVYTVSLDCTSQSTPKSNEELTNAPVLSPGRKYIAFLESGVITVLNSKTGEVVGTYLGAGKSGSIVFRPDGKRIALTNAMRVQVWDFSTGELYRDIGFSTPYYNIGSPTWPAPGYILLGGRYLVDIENRALLWEYLPTDGSGSVDRAMVIARRFWFLATKSNWRALVPFTMPDEAAREASGNIQLEDPLILKPGMDVSIEIQIEGTKEDENWIRDAFAEQLKANGFQLDDSAAVRVIAGMDQMVITLKSPNGETREKENSKFYVSHVTIVIDNRVAWRMSADMTTPGSRLFYGGESPPQAAKRWKTPDLKFFDRVVLPKYLCAPCNQYTFGATELTPDGPKSVEPVERKR